MKTFLFVTTIFSASAALAQTEQHFSPPPSDNGGEIVLRPIGTAKLDELKPFLIKTQTTLLQGGVNVREAFRQEKNVDWLAWARKCSPKVVQHFGPVPEFGTEAKSASNWLHWTKAIVYLHFDRDGSVRVSEGHLFPTRKEIEALYVKRYPARYPGAHEPETIRRHIDQIYRAMMNGSVGFKNIDMYLSEMGYFKEGLSSREREDIQRRAEETQIRELPQLLDKWAQTPLSYEGIYTADPSPHQNQFKGLPSSMQGLALWSEMTKRYKCPLPKGTKFDHVVIPLEFTVPHGPYPAVPYKIGTPESFLDFAKEKSVEELGK